MLLELVDVVGDAAARLVLAELVRQVDVDGLCIGIIHVAPAFGAFQARRRDYHRRDASVRLLLCRPACCPDAATPATGCATGAVWNPAAAYITAGQDEPGYRSWYLAAPWRARRRSRRSTIIWRSASVGGHRPDLAAAPHRDVVAEAAAPSRSRSRRPSEWPNIVQTLRYIRDYVIPAVGPVEPVSVYRNPALNVCAGGAPESAHKHYSAVDMVPLRPIDARGADARLVRRSIRSTARRITRASASTRSCASTSTATKFRRWNMDPAVAAQCPPLIHPEDAASVGQPLPRQLNPSSRRLPPPVAPPRNAGREARARAARN